MGMSVLNYLEKGEAMRTYPSTSACLVIFCASVVSSPSMANDTLAALGAGGLEMTTSTDIVMEKEDLFLSPAEIRVRYEFRNDSDQDITERVSFPMPVVPFGPMDNVQLPDAEKTNFVDLTVYVDGKVVKPKLEERAIVTPPDQDDGVPSRYPEGADLTVVINQSGLPVNANLGGWKTALQALSPNERKRLVREGLLRDGGDKGVIDDLSPRWSLKAAYHWQQTFPANKTTVVEHLYKPVVGSSFYTGEPGDLNTIRTEFGKRYCLDHAGIAGLNRMLEKAKAGSVRGGNGPYLYALETEYVLKTGANWKDPIGQFKMTIDKLYKDAIMSTCADGFRKVGATTFMVERNNFEPEDDVGFVVFRTGDSE